MKKKIKIKIEIANLKPATSNLASVQRENTGAVTPVPEPEQKRKSGRRRGFDKLGNNGRRRRQSRAGGMR